MNWHPLLRTILLGWGILILVGVGSVLPSPVAHAVSYACNGDPANGGSSSLVCHALAITNHNYYPSVTPYIYGADARIDVVSLNCWSPCDGWITNEVKLADWNGNYVEAGYFIGYLGNGSYSSQAYYWADSRPQDVNLAHYHIFGSVGNGDFNQQVEVQILKANTASTYTVAISPVDGPCLSSTNCNYVQNSTNNAYVPTQVQMGQFLIGTQGMGANLARFSYRYYSDSSYKRIGIFGNYRYFVDHPPYMYSYAPDTDFGTYCCVYNPTLGSLARFQPPAETTRHIQQPSMPDSSRTTSPLGMAAIGLGDTTAHFATASITQNDVLRYANQFPMPLVGSGKAKVTSAELLTSQQVSTLLGGETTGFPNDHALWFVQVSGTFVFPGGKGMSHHGYEVFDPSTGNLVMFGGMR